MVYFKTDSSVSGTSTGANFSGGTLAISAGAGLLAGALGALAVTSKKRKENVTQTA